MDFLESEILGKWDFGKVYSGIFWHMKFKKSVFGETVILGKWDFEKVRFWESGILGKWNFGNLGY